MVLSVVDVLIVLFIILGAVIGYRSGFIKEGIHFIGVLLITVIAFSLKDMLMVLLYENLPFFNFFGSIRGITSINILLYQLLSFVIIFAALFFLLRVLIVITGIIEWLVKITVFLKITSKLLGIVVGALEYYVYVFIVLYILNVPVFNLKYVSESNLGNKMLTTTPILSTYVDDTIYTYTDVWKIIKNRDNDKDSKPYTNTLILATLLDHDLVTIDSAKKLVQANKIQITDVTILDKYEDDDKFYKFVKGYLKDD